MTMPAAVRALSGDAELLAQLEDAAASATVHSVFDRVVNLRPDGSGGLWTLATAGVDDAPATVLLDLPRAGALELEVGDAVTSGGGRLRGPRGQIVELASARRWRTRLPHLPLPARSLTWLREHLRSEGIRGGALCDPPAPGSAHTTGTLIAEVLTTHLQGLLDSVRRADSPTLRHHASSLVGLGTGLTPAGDDALLGVVLVATMPGSMLAPARADLTDVVHAAATRTTDISHAALAQAVRGRTRESLVALLHALAVATDEQTLARHASRVIAIGHTSGTDILTGLSAGLDLDHRLRGEK